MDNDLLETLIYLSLLGLLPYVAVEAFELAQRTMERRRQNSRH